MTMYQSNATIISALHQEVAANEALIDDLRDEYDALYPAFHYMRILIRALRENVGLREEWANFLETAGMCEPEWKSEYDD